MRSLWPLGILEGQRPQTCGGKVEERDAHRPKAVRTTQAERVPTEIDVAKLIGHGR